MNDYQDEAVTVHVGDVREVLSQLPSESVQCVVTSPPYWGLRDYGVAGQLGLEATPDAFVCAMVDIFRDVRRVLRRDGTLWLNLGDSYASGGGAGTLGEGGDRGPGLKAKDLCGIPWRVAFALQADGWWLRSEIIWSKPNPMPESVTDRPTKAHETVFLLTKCATYYYDTGAIREEAQLSSGAQQFGVRGGKAKVEYGSLVSGEKWIKRSVRNKRTVWEIATQPYPDAHFATFPEELARIPILAGTKPRDVVIDPFAGSGTTLMVAKSLDRQAVGVELNAAYLSLIVKRVQSVAAQVGLPLTEVQSV